MGFVIQIIPPPYTFVKREPRSHPPAGERKTPGGRQPPRRGGAKYQARCGNRGRGKPLPYGDGCSWVRDVQRVVEDAVPYGCETGRSVVGAAALGRPRTWMKVGETGRRRRRPLRDGTEYRTRCESAGHRGRRPLRDGAKSQARCGNGGRGKPLPYGDGRTRVRDVQRDVEYAVPYGVVRNIRRGAETAGGASPSPTETGVPGVRDVQRDVEDAVPYGVVRTIRRGAETAEGVSPSPTETGVPGCGTYSGTSRTPSPTGARPVVPS